MTAAGMIYSSNARLVSVMGSGTLSSSFRVTPLLDYEITSDLFNVTKPQYITAAHFCLSTSTISTQATACSRCANSVDFTIELTDGSFPLKITNNVQHSAT